MKFFSDRLAHRIPIETLYWRDLLLFGTTANVAFLIAALVMAANDYPAWASMSVFLIPLPYNLFMWHCVWQTAGFLTAGARLFVRTTASAWLAIVIVV